MLKSKVLPSSRCVLSKLTKTVTFTATRSFITTSRLYNSQTTDISSKQYANLYQDAKNTKINLSQPLDTFLRRHMGPSPSDTDKMLKTMGFKDLTEFVKSVIPPQILELNPLQLEAPQDGYTEQELLKHMTEIANKNNYKVKNLIGKGYYGTILPPIIQRNVLESPEWYTSYTPYQPEISQGRLESLLNFQTVISELTGLPIANSSLLDEGTAAGEALLLSFNAHRRKKTKYIIDKRLHQQTKDILKTRCKPFNIELIEMDCYDLKELTPILENDAQVFGCMVQYPATDGSIIPNEILSKISDLVHAKKNIFTMVADIMALTLLKPPSDFNADIALGSTQRFGVPMGMGGPHAAYFAVTDKLSRKIPGRIVGISKDRLNKPALRLALQTREQHIKRDKATSNICTAQALLANIASNYVVYHGPQGIKNIAKRIYGLTTVLANTIQNGGIHKVMNDSWFDTLTIKLNKKYNSEQFLKLAFEKYNVNIFANDANSVTLSIDETVTTEDIEALARLFNEGESLEIDFNQIPELPQNVQRKDNFLQQEVFNRHHSETAMLRYLHRLQSRDLSLANSMIPLGSCTMKLNSTVEMMPISWPQFTNLHPFQPSEQVKGFLELARSLEKDLGSITGFDAISLQPNSGAQGEYAGLSVIRKFFEDAGQSHRNICLIPVSAHGTNPASAAMCGLKVVPVACLPNGSLDLVDLEAKAEKHKDNLAAIMITYPSTYGLYEPGVKKAIDTVHSHGGQVYLDGANMNAQLGLTSPGFLGADVCHLNLHKTFAIPHGGGGPGIGAIGVRKHLTPFLPSHSIIPPPTATAKSISAISSATYGNALVLPISYSFIKMLGNKGLPFASIMAMLNANYMRTRLEKHYKILFVNHESGINHCAHEFIIDLSEFKEKHVEAIDVAKRLQDYGFHAPTLAFPVPGTLMVEPTESENLEELDRFVDAMISIKGEIDAFVAGDDKGNVLKNAPHSLEDIVSSNDWETRGYSRELAAYPLPYLKYNKFWPVVTRLDDTYGDTHLICSCPTVEEMSEE
ncbi:glycine dehydrogenase (decarboxylating), mitochondrial [Monosporozyma servazzii]